MINESGLDCVIKQLAIEDVESTLDVVAEFIHTNYNNSNYCKEWLTLDFYEYQFTQKNIFTTFVAKTENKVVGFIMGAEADNNTYEIRQLYK